MGYTPGPWFVSGPFIGPRLARDSGIQIKVARVSGDETDAECIANTRLIAAAPALLEAGEKINALAEMMQAEVTAFLHPDSEITNGDLINRLIYLLDGPEQREAQGSLRNAIALAKGEQTNG